MSETSQLGSVAYDALSSAASPSADIASEANPEETGAAYDTLVVKSKTVAKGVEVDLRMTLTVGPGSGEVVDCGPKTESDLTSVTTFIWTPTVPSDRIPGAIVGKCNSAGQFVYESDSGHVGKQIVGRVRMRSRRTK